VKGYNELTRGGQVRRVAMLARQALAAWGLESAPLRPVHHFHNTTFRVGDEYALRVARPGYQTDAALRSEVIFLEHLAGGDVPAPVPVRTLTGEPLAVADGRRCLLFKWIRGRKVSASFGRRHAHAQGELAARLHDRSVAFRPPPRFERLRFNADTLSGEATGFAREFVRSRLATDTLRVIDQATELVRRTWRELDECWLIHGDIMPANTLWAAGRPRLIDFDDMAWAPLAYDLAVACHAYLERDNAEELWPAFLEGYAAVREPPPGLDAHFDGLLAGRRLLVALWLAGNQDHPAFTEAPTWLDREVTELRRILRRQSGP
jgi:Ser/Thr protein kinase RdoA (MazF antagonist)